MNVHQIHEQISTYLFSPLLTPNIYPIPLILLGIFNPARAWTLSPVDGLRAGRRIQEPEGAQAPVCWSYLVSLPVLDLFPGFWLCPRPSTTEPQRVCASTHIPRLPSHQFCSALCQMGSRSSRAGVPIHQATDWYQTGGLLGTGPHSSR